MKQLKYLLLFGAAALFSAGRANAQTVDDIIGKHIDAMGGKDNLSRITSLSVEGTMNVMGNDAPFTITIVNRKALKLTMDISGQQMVQCVTDTGGWTINPMSGGKAAAIPPDQLKAVKYQLYIPDLLCNYGTDGSKAVLLGKEDNAYKIEMTSPDSVVSTYYVDTASYLISKIVGHTTMQGQDVAVTNNFSNYKKTDAGFVFPFAIDTDFGGNFSLSRTVTKVEVNKEVDPQIFAMPAQ